jgi:hypothetical protein
MHRRRDREQQLSTEVCRTYDYVAPPRLKPRARAHDDNGLKPTKQVLGGHLDLRRAAALARREARSRGSLAMFHDML